MGETCSICCMSATMINASYNECNNIGILSIDELLPIFYFLNICDRLMAMRVCKKWRRILRDKQAWSVIDFHEVEKASVKFRAEFTKNEVRMLNFLKLYAGGSLREIYLSIISDEIVDYLRENCPNVKTVSLLRADMSNRMVRSTDRISSMLLFLSPTVRRYELRSPPISYFNFEFEEDVLQFLSQHAALQYLVIEDFKINTDMADALKALVTKTNLQEIQIIKPSLMSSSSLDDILAISIGSTITLKCFRIVTYADHDRFKNHGRSILLSNLVVSIGRWQNLKVLALRGVDCSEEAFESMIPGILNVESLELDGRIVNTAAILSIGNRLKKLKFLELGNGLYSVECINSLRHHPVLEKVWIHKDYNQQHKLNGRWLRAIYDVLVTLPNLKKVKLEGYRLLSLYSLGGYEDIDGVKLDIQNSYESDLYGW